MSQLTLLEDSAPNTERCRYDCGGIAVLGPERFNAERTCMNQSSTCQSCGKVAEVSHNLALGRTKRQSDLEDIKRKMLGLGPTESVDQFVREVFK